MKITEKLKKIADKYSSIAANEDNYSVGGGLDGVKFASNRHEDACNDKGKLTLGKACQLFAKAAGEELDMVKQIIKYAIPNMEWHHAGLLPKEYGGGMKKTYFLNSKEIVFIAQNFEDLKSKLEISLQEKKQADENKKSLQDRKLEFLKLNATQIIRAENRPNYFYETNREMNGKFGWFSSYGKSYNLPEYYTGWKFENIEKYTEFLNIT